MLDSNSDCSADTAEDMGQLDGASGAQGSSVGSHAATTEVQAGSVGSQWLHCAPPQA
jgi:hypothetical protein